MYRKSLWIKISSKWLLTYSDLPLVQSTVSEMKEDGIIYTVVVKQGHDSPTVPRVSPIFLSKAQCCVFQKFCPDVFTPLFPVHSVPFSARQSRDRGKAGPPSPSFLLHGWLILHLHLPLHLSHLHLHTESAGHPDWQVQHLYSWSNSYKVIVFHISNTDDTFALTIGDIKFSNT